MKFLSQITLLVIMLSTSIAFFSRSSIRQSFSGILKKSLSMSASDTASAAIKANKVMVFSKTKCPFCKKAKEALTELKVDFGLIELDALPGTEGPDLQAALKVMTGQGTVPNIFIGGKHLGGCDSTLAAIASGELQKMLK